MLFRSQTYQLFLTTDQREFAPFWRTESGRSKEAEMKFYIDGRDITYNWEELIGQLCSS